MDYEKVLIKVLKENNIIPTDEMLSQFERYYEMLIEYNSMFNLTSIIQKEDVYLKHFADSLLGVKEYKFGATLCDIGTGAGFPGIVIKIARPDLCIVLVDSLNKRVNFLNNIINALNLDNIIALHFRAEDKEFKKKYLNTFDYVVARAVANLNTLTEYCLPYVKVSGTFIAYKSDNITDEIDQALNCICVLGGNNLRSKYYDLTETIRRQLIFIDKVHNTDLKYPRDKNKPRTNPI